MTSKQHILDTLLFLEKNQYIINSKFYLKFLNFGHFELVFQSDNETTILYMDNCQDCISSIKIHYDRALAFIEWSE